MEVYNNQSEQEQLDQAKHFVSHNGKAIAVGIVIVIAVVAGWQGWRHHQQSVNLAASETYQKLTAPLSQAGIKPEQVKALADFVAESKTNYGALAALRLAKYAVTQNELAKAVTALQQGLQDTQDTELQAILTLRLARIQLSLQQADAALRSLDTIKGASFTSLVADIRGDIYSSKGDKSAARKAWEQGIAADASPELKNMLQMKLNNLG